MFPLEFFLSKTVPFRAVQPAAEYVYDFLERKRAADTGHAAFLKEKITLQPKQSFVDRAAKNAKVS
eukprot:SAG22_NODE_1121_length_5508_cov_6.904234_2_plen_66_part_00